MRQYYVEQVGVCKVRALLSTAHEEMGLIAVPLLFRVIWFESRPSMFRILLTYSSRSVLDVLLRTFLNFLLVELRYLLA